MIGTIRKHSKVMWGVIIGATVLTFIYWGSPTSRFGAAAGRASFGTLDGKAITTEQYVSAAHEVNIYEFMNHRPPQWPDKDPSPDAIYARLLLTRRIEDMHLHVKEEELLQIVANAIRSFGAQSPEEFQTKMLGNHATIEEFEHYLEHQLEIEELAAIVSASSGLVPEPEARLLFERDEHPMTVDAAFFEASNYLAQAPAHPPELTLREFYTNNLAKYRLADRVQVSYVFFNLTNYLQQAEKEKTNLTDEVEELYTKLGTNYFRDATTPDQARTKFRDLDLRDQAMLDARKDINNFATRLLEIPSPDTATLDALARSNGLQARVTQPFDEMNGPKEFDAGPNFPKFAFELSSNEPFAGPIPSEGGFYEISYKAKFPEETPSFEAVRDVVLNDYKEATAVQLARMAGASLAEAITNSPTRSFSEVCASAKVPVITTPPFALSAQSLPVIEDHLSLNQFKILTFNTMPGTTSGFIPTLTGGVIVHVRQLTPMDPAIEKARFPDYWARIRNSKKGEAFNTWLTLQLQRAKPGFTLLAEKNAAGPVGPAQ
jgi:hypothetical protein